MPQFVDEMLDPYRRLGDFAGRTPRARFWPFILLTIVGGWLLMTAAMAIGFAFGDGMPVTAFAIGYALWLVLLVPAYAGAVVRRLHDTGRSGWWAAPQGVLFATGLIAFYFTFRSFQAGAIPGGSGPPDFFLAGFVNNLVYLGWTVVLIVFAAQEGTRGANRYGAHPLERG